MPLPDITARLRFPRPLRGVAVRAAEVQVDGARGTEARRHPLPSPPTVAPRAAAVAESVPAPLDLRELLLELGVGLEELHSKQRQSLDELQQVAVELAIAAAEVIAGRALERDAWGVSELVAAAVEQLPVGEPPTVRLHPIDRQLLEQQLREQRIQSRWDHVELIADPGMARGSCRVEAGKRALVTTFHERLAEIRRVWLEEVEHAQAERRAVEAGGGGLQRVPDRRDTA